MTRVLLIVGRPFAVRLLMLALAVIGVDPAVWAQKVSEEVDVRIVQVPVVVTRNAKPVSGLTRDDFEVYVNGARQPIAYFDVLQFEPAQQVVEAAPMAPADLPQRRLTLVLFDLAGSSYLQIQRARTQVERLLESASANDFFAVATYAGAGHPRYLVPFTRDRLAAMRAVATLDRSRASDALSLAMLAGERAQIATVSREGASFWGTERESAEALAEGLRDFQKTVESFEAARGGSSRAVPSVLDRVMRDQGWMEHARSLSWAEALGAVADELRPLDGIKQVVLISDGSSLSGTQTRDFASAAERMHRHFRDAGVVLNVVDAAGLRAPWKSDTPHDPPPILFDAALGTGGTVFYGTGVENSVRLLADTRSVTYLIGIRPPAGERDHNELRVVVKDQPLFTDLSYRRGYSRATLTDSSVNGLLLADVMSNDIQRNDVTVQMKIRSIEPATIDVGIPSTELAAHADDDSLQLEVFVYAFDRANTPAAWKHRRVQLDVAKMLRDLKGRHFIVREQLDLPPGHYSIKALAHVIGRDRIGFARREIDIPAAQARAGK